MAKILRRPWVQLWILGLVQLGLWSWVSTLSTGFTYETDFHERPMLGVVGLLAVLNLFYLLAVGVVWRVTPDAREERSLLRSVWALAILMRLVLLWSHPIQEIDYYRYLWDGRALAEGVSPYAYSPAQIDAATPSQQRLVSALERSPHTTTIFERIDHRTVPSIYPPASQGVFLLAALITPDQAEVATSLFILKGLIVGFDLLVIFFVSALLRAAKMPPARAIVYALCPLVLKEFANSAHMDVIAIALVTGALALACRPANRGAPVKRRSPAPHEFAWAILWSISILAKFFPIVLAPLLWSWIRLKLGLRGQIMLAATAALVVALGYLALPAKPQASQETLSGLGTFASHWEINDLAFSIVHENLRPPSMDEARPESWYTMTSPAWRKGVFDWFARRLARFSIDEARVPFLLTQGLSATVVFLVAIGLALRRWNAENGPQDLLRRAFWTLATLWYFSATQNPWYWAWVLPFAVFVSRGWLVVSAFTLIYYLRFWLIGNFSEGELFGVFSGKRFFDEVLVWLQHGPFLAMLGWGLVRQFRIKGTPRRSQDPCVSDCNNRR